MEDLKKKWSSKEQLGKENMYLAYLKCSPLLFPLLFLLGRVGTPRFSLLTIPAVGIDWRVVLDPTI